MLLKDSIMTDKNVWFPQLFLRIAISVTMLSAVADRFGFWGKDSAWGNWENFEIYTRKLTFFLPDGLSVFSAYTATFFEILFLLVFALSMTMALGVKAPLDYSVWVGSAGAFLLAVQPKYFFSIDHLTNKL
jgi:putative oxidoreductase